MRLVFEKMHRVNVRVLQIGADADDVAFFAFFDQALAGDFAGVGAVVADDLGDTHFLVQVKGGWEVEFGIAEFHG
jgi:hypothetical protein